MFISNDNKIYLVCDSGYDLILLIVIDNIA